MADTSRDTAHPLVELTRARIIESWRDPAAIFWVFGFPVLLVIALGVAFRDKAPDRPRALVTGPAADAVLAAVQTVADTPVDLSLTSAAAARDGLRAGKADVVVNAVRDDAGTLALTYRLDPTRPGADAAQLLLHDTIERAHGRVDRLRAATERVPEPGGRYIDFLIPGLLGMNIMGSCLWSMGYAVVDARRRKLMRRFAVTPMNRAHFLLAFFLSRFVFLALEVGVLVVAGVLLFDVAVTGSLITLGLVAIFGTLAFSGLALLVGARTESTEVVSGWMNFVQLPMWLLSGVFFDYARFPDALQTAARLLPLTALNDALRAVMNEGAGLVSLFPQLGLMLAWGAVSFALALRVFRWQ